MGGTNTEEIEGRGGRKQPWTDLVLPVSSPPHFPVVLYRFLSLNVFAGNERAFVCSVS